MKTQKLNKLSLIILAWLMLFTLQVSAQIDSKPKRSELGINKLPLKNFGESLLTKWENKKIDLTKSFSVELKGTLTDEGTLDASKSRYTRSEGDENIVKLVKSGIEAVGESRFFISLRYLDVRNITITVVQDNETLAVRLMWNTESPEIAKTTISGLNAAFAIAKYTKKLEINGREKDELKRQNEIDQLYLLNNTSVASQDNIIFLKIALSKTEAHKLINRNLEKESERRQK